MPGASAGERNKATRVRRAIKAGKATPTQRAWLAGYEERKLARRRANPPIPPHMRKSAAAAKPPQPRPPVETPKAPEQPTSPDRLDPPAPANPSQPVMSAPASQARESVQAGFAPISFDSFAAPGDSTPDGGEPAPFSFAPGVAIGGQAPAPTCDIPDCPACKSENAGGMVCQATGKRVWPPMSIESAKALAGAILGLIGLAIRMFRRDKHFVTPNEHEVLLLATGLREVQMRRASWMGAADDILMVLMGVGGYGRRALKEAPPKEGNDNGSE